MTRFVGGLLVRYANAKGVRKAVSMPVVYCGDWSEYEIRGTRWGLRVNAILDRHHRVSTASVPRGGLERDEAREREQGDECTFPLPPQSEYSERAPWWP